MRLGLDRLWLLLVLALPALASLIVPLPAVDLAYQVRAGELILATGSIPATDTFTFTAAGATWVDQQWLAQVLFALLHRAGGWELLAVVRAVMVAATFGLVAAAGMARGASPRTAAILALLSFVLAAPALAMRPQLFGILGFAFLLWLVADRRRHPRRLWLAPLAIILWANVHGSVVLAPVLLGYAWLEDLVDRRHPGWSLGVLIAGALATLANPFGLGVWGYALGVGANPEITSQVSEWQRTTPFTAPGLLFYVSVVAAALLAIRRRERLSWPAWLWLAGLFAVGAWTVRGLAWWPLGAAVIVAGVLPAAEVPRRVRANVLNTMVVGLLGVALLVALPWWRPPDPLTGRAGILAYAPSGLAVALRERVHGGDRVFVPQAWGSWFEWAAPGATYFTDSRIELFPVDVWRENGIVSSGGEGASAILERWAVGHAIVDGSNPSLRDRLLQAGWQQAYADGDGAILLAPGQ